MGRERRRGKEEGAGEEEGEKGGGREEEQEESILGNFRVTVGLTQRRQWNSNN